MAKTKLPKQKLTPEQQKQLQRQKSLSAVAKREMAHSDCQMELRIRGNNYGLFCQEHNKWITWISRQELKILGDQNVCL